MTPQLIQHLRTIEANTARALEGARETVFVGPFVLGFHPTDAQPFLNYAIPLSERADQAITPKLIGRLREEFQERGRRLRFEYFQSLWPGLEELLKASGLVLQLSAPLMLCSPGDVRRVYSPGLMIQDLEPSDVDATYALLSTLGAKAFGQPVEVKPETLAENREHVRVGRYRFSIAYLDGQPAGIGGFGVKNDELAGIGTVPEFRRRGVAVAVSSHLVLQHFDRGGRFAWLSAADPAAESLYTKVGFRTAGSQLNYIDPE